MQKATFEGVEYDARHGGPFDRGSADSYYWRSMEPHFYFRDTGMSGLLTKSDMTADEIKAYIAGYECNELYGHKKDYGDDEEYREENDDECI